MHRDILKLALSFMLLSSNISMASAESDSRDHWRTAYLDARKEEEAQRWAIANVHFKQALQDLDKGSSQDNRRRLVDITYKYGCSLESNNQYDEAIDQFKKCDDEIDEIPGLSKLWKATCEAHLANAYFRKGDGDDGTKMFREALAIAKPTMSIPQKTAAEPKKTDKAVIGLNNEGVKALNTKDYLTAIEKFQSATYKDPAYSLARQNLAIAYNNYALTQSKDDAVKWFHRAEYVEPSATARENLAAALKTIDRDAKNGGHRIALGDKLAESGDYEGAVIEYAAAYELVPSRLDNKKFRGVALLYLARKARGEKKDAEADALEAKATAWKASAGSDEVEMMDRMTKWMHADGGKVGGAGSLPATETGTASGSPASDLDPAKADEELAKVQEKIKGKTPSQSDKADVVEKLCNAGKAYAAKNDTATATKRYSEALAYVKGLSSDWAEGLSDELYGAAVYFEKQDRLSEAAEALAVSLSGRLSKGEVNPELLKYVADTQHSIRTHWKPPKENVSKHIVTVFSVYRTGAISNLRITESSHIEEADKAACEAVKDVDPLPPLPDGSPDKVDIQFTFDYNVRAKDGTRL